jgi:hypothetical protein
VSTSMSRGDCTRVPRMWRQNLDDAMSSMYCRGGR